MKRKNELLFTLSGLTTGLLASVFFSMNHMLIINGEFAFTQMNIAFSLFFGLIFNKIGSEIDRKIFFNNNNSDSEIQNGKKLIDNTVPEVNENKKSAFKEKMYSWISEVNEYEKEV